MEITQPPLTGILAADTKRHCIRIKARIRIAGDDELPEPVHQARPPYQAYCETVTSSRPQSPDIFTTPPTHSEPFHPVQTSKTATYTARIVTRKRAVTKVSVSPAASARSRHESSPTKVPRPTASDSKQHVAVSRVFLKGGPVSANQQHIVSQTADPRGSRLGGTADDMLRNRTPSLSQVQANTIPRATPQIITARTPLRQKRYGRMDYHPLPPLPPSPPDTPVNPGVEQQHADKTTVNSNRCEIKRRSLQPQDDTSVPHLSCVDPPPRLPPAIHHPIHVQSATAEHERPQSKASRRTVTFADDTTLSSRSSSPDHYNQIQDRSIRQSRSFTSDAQIASTLRLYRSHDSLLVANNPPPVNDTSASASRRTAPKDFKHRYTFGQRPTALTMPSPGLGRSTNPDYNPRLSTSRAQYRGLATLPRALPSSLRVAEPQTGPRRPPWGSLGDLEEQRGKRVDKRERDQAKLFRAQTLSEATTVLGSTDSFGKEAMKKEVEGYRKQVVSVYPDMAFDGTAGKGGRRSCCCVVM
jgi:hypothetical protein